ncbi:MAG TPA: hypothetical protein VL492_04745 [Methylovirgula sp.]|jgi:hypothetical protein|nr:hypothetical protein [Methylovirgula sp.]
MQASKDGIIIRKAELSDIAKSRASQAHVVSRQMQRLGGTRPGIMHRPLKARKPRPKRNSWADGFVVLTGIAMAVSSASFATYMMSTDHSHPVFNGAEHLMLFAQPSRGSIHPLIARVPGGPAVQQDQGIDYTATGSIPGQAPDAPTAPHYKIPSIDAPQSSILSDFTLRGVAGNVAMIETPDGMYRLEVGSELPGGGKILSIEWISGRFVVVTTRGIIRESQS